MARDLTLLARKVAGLDESPEDYDPIQNIIDGAEELGIMLTSEQVQHALQEVGLEADDISSNQPVLPNSGPSLPSGMYTFFKGGEVDSDFVGWVTDDAEHAAGYGPVSEIVVECTGASTGKWTIVHDWDGLPQLVQPGPECSKITSDGWLILKGAKSVKPHNPAQ